MTSLIFGDLFEYNDKTYIFLAKTENIIYVAEVLGLRLSKKIDEECQRAIARNRRIDEKVLYCYVKLQTEEFKERLAFLGGAGKDGNIDYRDLFSKLPIALKKEDLKQIYSEITRDKSLLPIGLKELIKKLDI